MTDGQGTQSHEQSPFSESLGIRLISADKDEVMLHMPATPPMAAASPCARGAPWSCKPR
ncbi:hypothetical protein [Paracoccus lutimaris]|uniref:Uncharacterized protein n=1 Tax=Paracoccus lutimaris TaxID=1490030 RepID=A0A368Z7D0_9RHOB|nr:hypothetical protein [Paracoccus lutimaris]RCW88323.1 hypothetical protein DFP89_102253 [Paracoccus lutimaris]